MSGNNNVTVAIPGHDNWGIWWTWNNHGLGNFQLDIVGFLAVLGEASVLANAQVSALSRLFYLPRIMPAPQALLRTSRPTSLRPAPGKVTGIHSGNVKDHVHHVANILLGQDLEPYSVRCVKVTKKDVNQRLTRVDSILRGQKRRATGIESGPVVKAKASGPQTFVALTGFVLAIVLLVVSVCYGDGMSIVATLLLSLLSTVVGICNKWTLQLPQRAKNGPNPPKGDAVIRYPNGSYLVVRCEETVARELYFAPEEIEYQVKNLAVYRMLALVGTLMLMVGVIALANSKLQMQVAWAGAFIIINIAHWIAAALPQRLHWDLSCYEVEEEGVEGGPKCGNFTEALWKAILLTKSCKWVTIGSAAPRTPVWDAWLLEAEQRAADCGERLGTVDDAVWHCEPGKSTIWVAPVNWKPKEAWDELKKKDDAEKGRSAPSSPSPPPQPLSTTTAVTPSVNSQVKFE